MWYLLKKLLNIEYKVSTPVSHIGLETPNISNKKISLQFVEAGHEISKYLSQFSPDCVREFMKMNFYFFFFFKLLCDLRWISSLRRVDKLKILIKFSQTLPIDRVYVCFMVYIYLSQVHKRTKCSHKYMSCFSLYTILYKILIKIKLI